MKVMVFGATGAVGRPLVGMLRARGHEVAGTTRDPARAGALRDLGVEPIVCDALDADAVARVLDEHRPEVIVNQLTSLSAPFNPRRYVDWVEPTNILRSRGTRNLVDAARAAGTRLLVSQSIAFSYTWDGSGLAAEDDALLEADGDFARAVTAMTELEQMTLHSEGLTGIVLRYGYFYGPGTSYSAAGDIGQMVRKRRFPIVGAGTGVFSFVHVEDAAAATVAAIERGVPGVFNVVDDDPAAMRDWLPAYAAALGAKPPRRVPLWLARLVTGRFVADGAARLRGASNARARRELGWEPRYASWRQGFRDGLG